MEQLVNPPSLVDMIRDTVRYGYDVYPTLYKRKKWMALPMDGTPYVQLPCSFGDQESYTMVARA